MSGARDQVMMFATLLGFWLLLNGSLATDVWLVGGALRDRFLGLDPKDWDLATSAGVEDAFQTMALVEACFRAMETPSEPLTLD